MRAATTQLRIEKKALAVLCLLIVVVILAAGLWPFNPFPRNRVDWLERENGLRFDGRGVVFGSWNAAASADGGGQWNGTLELWLQPGPNRGHEGVVLAFYQPGAPERFKLFQWRDSILLLYKDDNLSPHREIDVDDAFHPETRLLITVTSGTQGTSVYLNGALAQTSRRFALSPADLSGQLVLGTSPVNNVAWTGRLRGLAFYGHELTAAQVARHLDAWSRGEDPQAAAAEGAVALYTFNEHSGNVVHDRLGRGPDLDIPKAFRILHKPLLEMPWRDFHWNRENAQEIAINIAGFVPFGFFLCAYLSANPLRRHAALATIVSGAALSVAIEILQAYLPTRTSSMADVVTNTLGTSLGVLLFGSRIAQTFLAKNNRLSPQP
jgi:hypothetical protein